MCRGIFGNINEVCLIGTFTLAPPEEWPPSGAGVRPLGCGRACDFFFFGGGREVWNLMGLRISKGKN